MSGARVLFVLRKKPTRDTSSVDEGNIQKELIVVRVGEVKTSIWSKRCHV
jgi:hypothetical protein